MDKELEDISKVVESDLKKNYIKNMIQGFEMNEVRNLRSL